MESEALEMDGATFLGSLLNTHLHAAAQQLAQEHRDYTVEQIFDAYHEKFKASERLRDLNMRALMQQEQDEKNKPTEQ